MAGAGYKLFNTGDVLTAAQVNTYLMQQTVMVFASSAARTSALSGVLAEGMVSYLQDTNTLEVYDGSAWVGATGDITGLTAGTGISISSATGPVPTITSDVATTFDAKGDLVVGTGADTFAKLTVGNSGDTIVADSSATTGLRWQGNFAAGKNAIINGDFRINQRSFTSTTTVNAYGHDRWYLEFQNGTVTYSNQTFTAGTAPVAGYEGINFARLVTSGQASSQTSYASINQKIEDVRTFAGQTVTVSFWAKATSGTPKVAPGFAQIFGTGGSSAVTNMFNSVFTLSTSWARYSTTITIPSIAGKTIGTNSTLQLYLFTSCGTSISANGYPAVGSQDTTIDFWGVQVEAGNVATAFQTATGTLAGELAACQRYYYRTAGLNNGIFGQGLASSTTTGVMQVPLPVTMRVKPTSIDSSSLYIADGVSAFTGGTVTIGAAERGLGVLNYATTGLTQFRPYYLSMTSDSGYVGFSAEL